MATFRASNYNLGPALGNVNADNGWGSYKWPFGVPLSLLGTASYGGVRSVVRKELATLFSLAYQIAREVHGYTIHTRNPNGNGEAWGPWGYENRAISGTSTASNHSRGRANDWNAPYNGYANGFSNIVSDFPPAMVRDLESIGLSWGGRYGDAMHLEYARTPGDVPADEARARSILGQKNVAPAPPKPEAPSAPAEKHPTPAERFAKDDDMPSIIVSPGKPDMVVFGEKALQLKDGASTKGFQASGIPTIQVANVDWDEIWNNLYAWKPQVTEGPKA